MLNVHSMRPHELSRLTMSLLREQQVQRSGSQIKYSLWKSVAVRTRQIIPDFSPSELSTIVFGLGKSSIRDKELLSRAAAEIFIPQLTIMTLNDISHLLSGYARVDVCNDILFDLASREIARKIHSQGSLADIASIFSSFARLHYSHPLLFEILGKRAALVAPQSTASSIEFAQIIHSVALLGYKSDARLLAIMASEICRRIDSMPVFAIAKILDGYKKLGVRNQFLIEVALDESFKRRHEFEPKSIGILLNAIGRLKCGRTLLLFDYFVSDLAKRGFGKFDLPAITLAANGISNFWTNRDERDEAMKQSIGTIFISMGDRISGLAGDLNPRSIAILVKAFGSVQARHGPFLYNIPKHICAGEMSLAELGMVMKGYAQLGIRNDELMGSFPDRIVELLEQSARNTEERAELNGGSSDQVFALTVRDHKQMESIPIREVKGIMNLLEAYAVLMIGDKRVTSMLVRELDRNRDILTNDELLLVLPKCLNNLHIIPPDTLRKTIDEALRGSKRLLDTEMTTELNQLLQ